VYRYVRLLVVSVPFYEDNIFIHICNLVLVLTLPGQKRRGQEDHKIYTKGRKSETKRSN